MLYYSYLAVHPETKVAGYAGVTGQLSTMQPPKEVEHTKPIDAWLQGAGGPQACAGDRHHR